MSAWPLLLCVLVPTLARPGQAARYKNTDPNAFSVTLKMPHVVADQNDRMICLSYQLEEEETYILRYVPKASKKTAHHLMVFGCQEPGSSQASWPCSHVEDQSGLRPVCNGSRQIVYAWALDAPAMTLPEGVGLRVGGKTGINFLVLQLHYKNRFKAGQRDESGVTLYMTRTPQEKQAGFYILGSYGYVPPRQPEFHMESGCLFDKDYPIYPISYRVHAHDLGYVTSAYRLRDDQWREIGRMSPQLPEAFYNVTSPGIVVKKGDGLLARCTMNSMAREDNTMIGSTYHDEMCNFYILYYTFHQGDLNVTFCFRDAQTFHWSDYSAEVPEIASSLDGVPGADEVNRKFHVTRHVSSENMYYFH